MLRSSIASMSGFGGGSEGHGGVPAGGQGYFGSAGRGRDLAYELKRARGPRRGPKRWWQFWRRGEGRSPSGPSEA